MLGIIEKELINGGMGETMLVSKDKWDDVSFNRC